MAVSNIATLLLVTIAFAGIFHPGNRVVGQECKINFGALLFACGRYIRIPGPPVAPSQACCNLVQQADIPCLCGKVTKEIERSISMEKAVYIAKYCQRPLQSGTKCGSKKAL
ncbi:putative Lipid binding protein [Cinnamomum micranthum f. kanehirae]|uniref:Putative Lipid binding protein n=1 Tax=Cinnamomum micranthum f. kanehirae TaxID=337451 RepID=A0A3S3MVJ4_9MAGN|nr:putative Lipid binding protein [Cinnamomum micranthum f. kanehirae]